MPKEKEPAADAVEEKTPADAGANERSAEELLEALKKAEEDAIYYKEQANQAFEKRDKEIGIMKRQMKEQSKAKKDESKAASDLEKLVEGLQAQLEEKDKIIADIKLTETRNEKLGALKNYAREHGLKEAYLDRLDKFINLDEVDPGKKVSLRIAVDTVKQNFPDLFSTNSEAVDRALPNPKLKADGGVNYKERYQALLDTPVAKRAPDHFQKLAELKELIVQTGG